MDSIKIPVDASKSVEYCFQFDDDEPVVFASQNGTSPKLTLELGSNLNQIYSFKDKEKNFKIFARELSEEGKKTN
jgi:hypothetical protein